MTRWMRLLAALFAVALLAAACGDSDDDSEGDTDAATEETDAPADDGGTDDGGTDDTEASADTTEADAGGGEAAGGEGSIWVLLPDSASSPRWEADDRRFFQQGFEAAGLVEGDDFTIVNAEGDSATQISQAEQAVADGASVILLVNLDSGSGATIIDIAREGGAAVIDYDRLTAEGDGADVYISFDNVAVGRTMADVLEPEIDALGLDQPQVVLLNGGETDNNAFLFRDGYAAVAEARAEAGDWAIVDDQFVPGWEAESAQTIMEQILVGANNEVDAVFAANDNLANAAINALENAGLDATTIPLSGQDASVVAMQNILLGRQSMSVYKPIEPLAGVAAQAALALRAGEDLAGVSGDFERIAISTETGFPTDEAVGPGVVPYLALNPIAVTADNMADTVIADGFRTWDEICTGEVEAVCPEEAG
jgi:D-xylose transport system substrate-binding protein